MTKVDLSKPSLRALAIALRSPMPKGFFWDYVNVLRDAREAGLKKCGSVGCAIGLAKTLWPQAFPEKHGLYDDRIAKVFGISEVDVNRLFWQYTTHGQNSYSAVKPRMVAKSINRYLKEGAWW